jgi:hypothetical protein
MEGESPGGDSEIFPKADQSGGTKEHIKEPSGAETDQENQDRDTDDARKPSFQMHFEE